MAFTEDLDIFFNRDEFAVEGAVNGSTFNCIFDTPTQSFEGFDVSVENEHPFIHCKTSDLTMAGAKRKDPMTIDGADYLIAAIRREGQGTSIVWLKTV